jgi:ParB-like chromosome segregation protein Spo0J
MQDRDHGAADHDAAQPRPSFHPLAELFPLIDDAALAELAADIKAESQREPIFLWRDQIIDGRNRYRACQIAGIEPVFKRVEFPGGEQEALAYVLTRNLKRQHAKLVLAWTRGSPQPVETNPVRP